jgi:hypothetical protein
MFVYFGLKMTEAVRIEVLTGKEKLAWSRMR